jgi:flagellar biosynthesis chaperone FliJ
VKRFRFRLESVLRWRQTLASIEEDKLRKLYGGLRDVERSRAEMENLRRRVPAELAGRSGLTGAELTALDTYLRRLAAVEQDLRERKARIEQEIQKQRQAVVEAHRQVRLLERLRARRLAEWQADFNRENERVAADNYLARWRRGS